MLLFTYDEHQLRLLRDARFCRTSNSEFGICVGAMPWNQQSHYHKPDAKGIKRRANLLVPLFTKLFSMERAVQLVTIARSMRDGYTSRETWRLVEDTLLNVLRRTAREAGVELAVEYDDELLGGRIGWTD